MREHRGERPCWNHSLSGIRGRIGVISGNKLALLHFASVEKSKYKGHARKHFAVLPASDAEPFGQSSVIYGHFLNPRRRRRRPCLWNVAFSHSHSRGAAPRVTRNISASFASLLSTAQKQAARRTTPSAATRRGAGGGLCTCRGEVHAG